MVLFDRGKGESGGMSLATGLFARYHSEWIMFVSAAANP